jgi:hypothetical protein
VSSAGCPALQRDGSIYDDVADADAPRSQVHSVRRRSLDAGPNGCCVFTRRPLGGLSGRRRPQLDGRHRVRPAVSTERHEVSDRKRWKAALDARRQGAFLHPGTWPVEGRDGRHTTDVHVHRSSGGASGIRHGQPDHGANVRHHTGRTFHRLPRPGYGSGRGLRDNAGARHPELARRAEAARSYALTSARENS